MSRFLLVHGSGHGAWCWRDVVPALAALGHEVETLDLPGSGDDPTPLEDVTLGAYVKAILARLDAPTVLVGHSAGGFPIRAAAEADPTRIARLIYLCAYIPRPGASMRDMRKEAPGQPLEGALEIDPTRRVYRFNEGALEENLYGDCPPGIADFARPRLGWQAIAPQATPVDFTGRGAAIPASYILCENDRTIPPAHQLAMAEAGGIAPGDLYRLPSGHSPFFAAPERLAALLDKITRA